MRILDLSVVPGFPTAIVSRTLVALGMLAGLALWLLLALDGRYHPDESLYLYMAAYSSIGEILDPALAPAYSFYISRILHLLIARSFFALLGPGEATALTIAAVYALFVLAALLLAAATIRRLVTWRSEMVLAWPILATSPIVVWLVGKTLPESPALLATSIALYAFVRGLEIREARRALPWLALASFALVAVALTRNILIVAPATLGVTLLLFGGWRFPPARVLARGAVVAILAATLLFGTLALLGIDLSAYFWVYGLASEENSPIIVRLYVGLMAGGPLLLAVPLAFLHRPRSEPAFLLAWFALATAATYVLLADLEARYLLANLVPLLGLGCLAVGALVPRLEIGSSPLRMATTGLVLTTIVLSGRLAQPFMEHEVKSDQLATVLYRLDHHYGGSRGYSLLTAWHHTDYHYLRVVHPDLRIHSVERTRDRRSVTELDEKDRFFYGDAIVLDFDALALVPRPWLYVGFEANPAITNFRWMTDQLPIETLRNRARSVVDRMAKRRHFHDTWVWRDPRLRVVPVFEHGHYRVAELVPVEPLPTAATTVDVRSETGSDVVLETPSDTLSATMLP